MAAARYLEPVSGGSFPLDPPRWCAVVDKSQRPLMISPLPGISRSEIKTSERSLWRYAAALPFACESPISLGEGCTPLLRRAFRGDPVHFKCEWYNPTCSFKDRGTSVMLSLLRQQGVKEVLEDSSGNGGASVACYAAAGGIKATIMAPASTAPAKTVQMRAHGASVELIPGSRQDTADAAAAAHGRGGGGGGDDDGGGGGDGDGGGGGGVDGLFYASHNWHPFFLQGTKTLAYELWEDLGFAAPKNIIIPTGAGSNILGCAIGFDELRRSGEIETPPRLFCAQPLLCSPIATAVLAALKREDGKRPPEEWNTPHKTMAEGTSIAHPLRLNECRDAILQSGGGAVRVTEEEMADATRELAAIGLYVEPTCAQAAAAYVELVRGGQIQPGDVTVIVLTSTGVKATPTIASMLGVAI